MAACRALILLVALLVPPSIATAQQADLAAASANLQNYRGDAGKRLTFICTPGHRPGQVYGTDTYTDDSSICSAAVHAGVTTFEKGGPVTVVIGRGQERYTGSARNGVKSEEFAAWPGSFTFDRRIAPARITWGTTARGVQGYTGSLSVICPEGGRVRAVWGSDIYTSDSSICSAALHAGTITLAKGGPVTIRMTEGRKAYEASSRNGVASREYGNWEASFEVRAASREVAATAPAPTMTRAPLDSSALPTRTRAPAGVATATPRPVPTMRAPSIDTSSAEPTATQVGTVTPTPVQAVAAPAAPSIVSATGFRGVAGPKYSQLSWNPAPGASGYRLTRYDPTTQQRITLRSSRGDTMFAQTSFTDTAVTPNRTYGYRLSTLFKDQNGALVSDPDTSQGVAVTPKDPNAPLALPPEFNRPMDTIYVSVVPLPPDAQGKTKEVAEFQWQWHPGAGGYEIVVGRGWMPDYSTINWDTPHYIKTPYLGINFRDDTSVLRSSGSPSRYCFRALSAEHPVTKQRVASPPTYIIIGWDSDLKKHQITYKKASEPLAEAWYRCPNAWLMERNR
jgi:hypothetical protein